MLKLGTDLKVYVFSEAIDLRQGFDRLMCLVESSLSKSVLKGGLYVFFSRTKDRVKILYWDEDGLAIWYKRLEEGKFKVRHENKIQEILGSELKLLLSGMELKRIGVRKKYL